MGCSTRNLFNGVPSRHWQVFCAAVAILAPLASAQTTRRQLASPLHVAARAVEASITPLSLDPQSYRALVGQPQVRLTNFALDATTRVELDLKPVEVFTPGARIVLMTARGEVLLPKPDVLVLVGTVVGHADSSVFLSLSPHGTRGWVEFGEEKFVISSGPGEDKTKPVVYDYNDLAATQINWMDAWTCGVDALRIPAGVRPFGGRAVETSSGSAAGSGTVAYDAQVAVETDFEFTNNVFAGSSQAASAYVATIFGAASEIYMRDVGTRLSVNFLRLWQTSADPWNVGNTSDQLLQFRSYWNANETGVFRHLTHFLSGRSLGGGVAWLDAVCVTGLNYGLSANLRGFFPVPVQDHSSSNWDIMVVTHEMGHNFGSVHTHNMRPVVDGCGNGDCTLASFGTIMSYCHQCSPGMSNLSLRFHERVIFEQILPFLTNQISCDIGVGPATIFAQPDATTACATGIVQLSVGAGGTSPVQIQWRKNGEDLIGESSGILVLDPVSASDAGSYDVVVSNSEGSTISDVASVAVVECESPVADVSGCRALTLEAPITEINTPVAFRVSAPSIPCLSSYINLDGVFVDEPAFHPAQEWRDVMVLGEGIRPGTQYEITMDFGTAASPRLTPPTVVTTARWGDVAGLNNDGFWADPDGAIAVGDILADIACFVSAPGAPPFERCDIHPAIPDGEVQIIDVLQVISAFQGLPFPFAMPGCP